MDRMEPYKWAGALGSDVKAISVIKKGRWFTRRQNLTDVPTDELTISQNRLFDLMTRPRVTNYVIGKLYKSNIYEQLMDWQTGQPKKDMKLYAREEKKNRRKTGKDMWDSHCVYFEKR